MVRVALHLEAAPEPPACGPRRVGTRLDLRHKVLRPGPGARLGRSGPECKAAEIFKTCWSVCLPSRSRT